MSHNQTVKVLIALVLLELLGAGVWYTSYSSTPAAAPFLEIFPLPKVKAGLYLKPEQAEASVGENLTAAIFISQERTKLWGVDIVLTYEPQNLAIEEVLLERVFSETPSPQIRKEEGKVRITTYGKEGTEIAGEVKLATLKIRPKIGGETRVDFEFSRGETADSNILEFENKTDILDKAEGAVYTVR